MMNPIAVYPISNLGSLNIYTIHQVNGGPDAVVVAGLNNEEPADYPVDLNSDVAGFWWDEMFIPFDDCIKI